jgi:hypothetical protein
MDYLQVVLVKEVESRCKEQFDIIKVLNVMKTRVILEMTVSSWHESSTSCLK